MPWKAPKTSGSPFKKTRIFAEFVYTKAMERPSAPHWDIDRQLDQPEDDFFGLNDDLLAPPPLPGEKPQKKQGLFSKILGSLVEKKDAPPSMDFGKQDYQELEELQTFQPPVATPGGPSDLTSHMQRLGTSQEKLRASFLAAESQSSLFEDIQIAQRKRYRTATWSLWIVAALFAWLGYAYGQDYLKDLTQSSLASESWLVDLVGGQIAYMLSVVCGILAPLGLFWVAVLTLHLFLGGLLELRPARLALSVAALVGVWVVVQLFMIPALASATVAALIVVAVVRILEWVLVRLGWY